MALQHIRAFRARREEFGDQINQDIVHCIADAMGNDDSPATVAIKTLAEEARCHYNTADKRVKEMADAGLIVIEKQGRFLTFKIVGEFDPIQYKNTSINNGGGEYEQRIGDLERQVENIVKVMEQLSHDLHTIVTSSSHDLHTTFTPVVNENVNKEGKKERRKEVVGEPPKPPLRKKQKAESETADYFRFMPEWIATGEFLGAWGEWLHYHGEKGKPLPTSTMKLQLEQMGKWGADYSVKVINHSIKQNYTGLVEPSANGTKPGKKTDTESLKARVAAQLAKEKAAHV